ncbi:MAG: ABC transporter ATP-binding protein [Armatimonadetes bacterium]|nr:ABC transporter ATP-binding protein [Armatimonadota bacterium]
MSTDYAIETRELTKRFRRRTAVDHLSMQVPIGSVFAFLGRNGAGKTTTIRILLNLLDRTSGDAYVLGLNPARDDTEIKRRVGYVAEAQRMYEWMTVKQLAWFCAGFYPTWDESYASELIKAMDLPPNEKLASLSRGTQAKVALLLAMAHRPELLILDEPTAGLDVVVRRDFLEGVIDLIQQEGRTVFFSTHLVHEVERVADWVGIVDRGKLVVSAPVEDLKKSVKRIAMTFDDAPPSVNLDGMLSHECAGRQVRATVREFSTAVLDEAKAYKPCSVDVEDLCLEDIFVALVGDKE